MKKVIFGIFAHPDDEAFGPSGSLIKAVNEGIELHLILLTDGEAGNNPDNLEDLGKARQKEWLTAANLIGATSTHALGYRDGHLDNQNMQEISNKVEKIVIESTNADDLIEFITLDTNGLTGHIDHIVAARASSLVFYRLKTQRHNMKRLRYFCLTENMMPTENTDWIYAEKGRSADEIDQVSDCRDVIAKIKDIIASHHTQREDGEKALKNPSLGIDNFIVRY